MRHSIVPQLSLSGRFLDQLNHSLNPHTEFEVAVEVEVPVKVGIDKKLTVTITSQLQWQKRNKYKKKQEFASNLVLYSPVLPPSIISSHLTSLASL